MISPGRNVVIAALQSTHKITKVYIQKNINIDEKIETVLNLSKQRGIKIEEKTRQELNKISPDDHHQGVIADVEFNSTPKLINHINENSGLYISFKDAQYDHNIGAIIRTAEIAGAKGVILPPKQKITPTIIRMSMGAIFNIQVINNPFYQSIKEFNKAGYLIFGLDMGGDNDLFEVNLPQKSLIIVGGEDKNISEGLKNKLDGIISIPQYGKINSLNMSVAMGIAIYKWREQNHLR